VAELIADRDIPAARAFFGVEAMVVEVGIKLMLPPKELAIKSAGCLRITRGNLDMNDRMLRHECCSFSL
jgi:hypothetical protein